MIEILQSPFPLDFYDNIYNEGNKSKMPDLGMWYLILSFPEFCGLSYLKVFSL